MGDEAPPVWIARYDTGTPNYGLPSASAKRRRAWSPRLRGVNWTDRFFHLESVFPSPPTGMVSILRNLIVLMGRSVGRAVTPYVPIGRVILKNRNVRTP